MKAPRKPEAAKLSMPGEVAKTLSIRESVLLFCIGSGLDRTGRHQRCGSLPVSS